MYKFTTPVARFVQGSIDKPQAAKDFATGAPKFNDDGTPKLKYFFQVAIPKTATPWQQTEWGKVLRNCAFEFFPSGESSRSDFIWRVADGDSTLAPVSNKGKTGTPNCDKPGYRGHWILKSESPSQAPLTTENKGLSPIPGNRIRKGDYVQARMVIGKLNNMGKIGLFVHAESVNLNRLGEPIVSSTPDNPDEVGYEAGDLSPVADMPMTPHGHGRMGHPHGTTPLQAAPTPAVAAPAPAPAAPYPQILNVPQLTSNATTTYEEYIKAGWTDAALKLAGIMV